MYHTNPYSKAAVNERLKQLLGDFRVSNSRGVIEYILGGEQDVSLLHIRVFDKQTAKVVYRRQPQAAKAKGVSNCPLCAIGHDANAERIYKESEMDADHVTAWSRGGATSEKNCQMLCKTHNRTKGNH